MLYAELGGQGNDIDPNIFLEVLQQTETDLSEGRETSLDDVRDFLGLIAAADGSGVTFKSFQESATAIPTLRNLLKRLDHHVKTHQMQQKAGEVTTHKHMRTYVRT
jgi:hypothetical protein